MGLKAKQFLLIQMPRRTTKLQILKILDVVNPRRQNVVNCQEGNSKQAVTVPNYQ